MEENNVTYYKSANWASLDGNFTPQELRQIAEEIEERHSAFQEGQERAKTGKTTEAGETGKAS